MEKKIIKWGIIGLGKIANKFATDLATIEHAELVAVASRSQENANYIATPHSFHKEHSILCLHHKKAVLCEKPFAMNLQDVSEMIAVAKENNTLLMEALWTYFLPHFNFVLEIIEQKKFGKLQELKADFGFHPTYNEDSRVFKKEVGGGSLLDIGIYPIFAALSTLGKPKKIEAEATFFENGADSSCSMIFEYENAKAHLKSTLLEKTIDFGYETIGYSYETEHFNHLIRNNKKESNIMTFEFSKNLMQTLDDVRKVIGLEY